MSFYIENLKDCGYIRESLYIPREKINTSPIEAALTFLHQSGTVIKQYTYIKNHIVVPRQFITLETLQKKVNLIDKRPKSFESIKIKDKIELRDALQDSAFEAIDNTEGILVLPCGTGKTVIAIKEMCRRKVPTLIIVNNEQLLKQWYDNIIKFTTIKDIGLIRGPKLDWKKPVVLGMLQTLAKRREKIPEEVRKYFGYIVWDEVDEISTPIYSSTSDIFYGKRLGVSATITRADGGERIFKYHIGPILLINQEFRSKPKVYFVQNFTNVVMGKYRFRWAPDKLNYGKLYTDLSETEDRNIKIKKLISQKLKEGRKIIVLGERVEQLQKLSEEFPGSGLCIGDVDVETRTEFLKKSKIIFATRKLSKRGLDQPDLDTLIMLLPMSDPGGLQQACGRILRQYKNKKSPEVYILEDVNIPPLKAICAKMRKTFNSWEFPIANLMV